MAGEDEVIDFGELPERRPSAESADGEGSPDDTFESYDGEDPPDDLDPENNLVGNDNDNDSAPAAPRQSRYTLNGVPVSKSFTTTGSFKSRTKAKAAELAAGAKKPAVYSTWSLGPEVALKPVKYICGRDWDDQGQAKTFPCGDVLVKLGEPLRCKNCGCRMLLKKRTERIVQFEAR